MRRKEWGTLIRTPLLILTLGLWSKAQASADTQASPSPPSPTPFESVTPKLTPGLLIRQKAHIARRDTPVPVTSTSKGPAGPPITLPVEKKDEASPAPSVPYEVWTFTFNASCSADWNQVCGGENSVNVSSGLEYCSHNWALATLNGTAVFEPRRTTNTGLVYYIYARGSGSFFDQWGSSVGVVITLRGITAGVSELVRQVNGCQNAQMFGKDVWACVRTGGNVTAVKSCLAGPGACEYFPELISMRCVSAPATVPPELRQACIGIGGIGGQGTEVYVPNSPQCH